MPEIIQSGNNGNLLRVDSDGRAYTFSVIEPEDKYRNRVGGVWSCYFTATPTGANDLFFYYKNTGVIPVVFTDLRVFCAGAETVQILAVSGTPTYTGATDITPTNRNLGNSLTPTATIKSDANITGLSENGVLFFQRLAVANKHYHISSSSNIIIPQNQAIALKAATGTALITAMISIAEFPDL